MASRRRFDSAALSGLLQQSYATPCKRVEMKFIANILIWLVRAVSSIEGRARHVALQWRRALHQDKLHIFGNLHYLLFRAVFPFSFFAGIKYGADIFGKLVEFLFVVPSYLWAQIPQHTQAAQDGGLIYHYQGALAGVLALTSALVALLAVYLSSYIESYRQGRRFDSLSESIYFQILQVIEWYDLNKPVLTKHIVSSVRAVIRDFYSRQCDPALLDKRRLSDFDATCSDFAGAERHLVALQENRGLMTKQEMHYHVSGVMLAISGAASSLSPIKWPLALPDKLIVIYQVECLKVVENYERYLRQKQANGGKPPEV